MRTIRQRTTTTAVLATLAGLGLAASALAITVYENDFSSQAEFDQIVRSGGGKACDRRYRDKQNTMLVVVHKGPATCAFRAPVQGDSELPNHALGVDAKILKDTPKPIRAGTFVELTLRAGGGGVGYTLRVFPDKHKFELERGPSGGGDFPARGENEAIKGINDRNRLSLSARGARIVASANGKELAAVVDSDPGQVTGRKVRFAIGTQKQSSKDVVGVVKTVGVGVPSGGS